MTNRALLAPINATLLEGFPFVAFDHPSLQAWWEVEAKLLNEAGVKFIISPDVTVPYVTPEGFPCSGYFADVPSPVLAVATGRGADDWIPVFLHELSHARQWLANCPEWVNNRMPDGSEAVEILDAWSAGKEFEEAVLDQAMVAAMDVERDCEERTLRLIQNLNLPICPVWYAKQANGYVQAYRWLRATRKWYPSNDAPYRNARILAAAPPVIVKKWDDRLKSAFHEVYAV